MKKLILIALNLRLIGDRVEHEFNFQMNKKVVIYVRAREIKASQWNYFDEFSFFFFFFLTNTLFPQVSSTQRADEKCVYLSEKSRY